MKKAHAPYKTIEEFTVQLRANGRFSFTINELHSTFSKSDKSIKQALFRLKKKGKIAFIRSGFYVLITPEYSKFNMIPTALFIDDLMKTLGKDYYVGLFSAAALQGATHQATMEYYVLTPPPAIRHIKNEYLSIYFFVKKNWPDNAIIKRKTDAGYINVSCPELTALDLLSYGNFGINRAATIIEELSTEMKSSRLKQVICNTPTSTIQRLGYMLDKVLNNNRLSSVLQNELSKRKVFPVLLVKESAHKGTSDQKWKVVENEIVETDL